MSRLWGYAFMVTGKSRRWLLALCMCLMMMAMMPTGIAAVAQAEVAIKLDAKIGFEGSFKETGLVPVQVSITNLGADIEGDLVVTAGDHNASTNGVAHYQPVSVASGVTKQVTIVVPGHHIQTYTHVSFMQGDQVLAQTRVSSMGYSGNTLMIGVLAQNPNTANYLGVMPRDVWTKNVKVFPMKPELVPVSGVQLQLVDMLILNNFALDTLNAGQIQAIREWTQLGGLLVVAGGPQYKKTVGTLQDLSPVEVTGEALVQTFTALQVEENALELTSPFTVSTGTLKEGKVLAEENGIPLFVARNFGEGKVLYVAYDLAQEPLASWSGNGRLWAEMLPNAFGSTLFQEKNYQLQDQVWPLRRASEQIPSLKLPEVSWFALLFGVYALIAGPILFFILRYKRKQNYMWVVVPILSVITGLGIFSFGAYQRGTGISLHQAGLVELNNSGQAKVSAVTAMFVPSSGDYKMIVHGPGLAEPSLTGRRSEENLNLWSLLDVDRAELNFRNVEFWSMRNVVSQQYVADTGGFVSALTYSNGKLKGTVTNQTKYHLRDVRILAGTQIQDVPELAPGSSVEVDLNYAPSAQLLQGKMHRISSRLVPQNKQTGMRYETREELMVQVLEERDYGSYDPSLASPLMIMGWTDQAVTEVSVEGSPAKSEGISLVKAPLQVKPSESGEVFYPAGSFDIIKSGNTAKLEEVPNGYYMEKGNITFDIDLRPNGEQLEISKLYMFTWSEDSAYFSKEIYNWQTESFEAYENVFVNNIMTGDKAASYVSEAGTLRIQLSHDADDNRHLGRPLVSVEGKVITR